MKKVTVMLFFLLVFVQPMVIHADECMEGDCDNGFGTGFTDDNKIYEGEWKNGIPHGKGKLYESKGKVVEGIWEKGELVKEESSDEKQKEIQDH